MKPRIPCPKCGAVTRVYAYRVGGGHLRRRRVCVRCGEKLRGRE